MPAGYLYQGDSSKIYFPKNLMNFLKLFDYLSSGKLILCSNFDVLKEVVKDKQNVISQAKIWDKKKIKLMMKATYEIEIKAFINDYFSVLASRGAYGGKYIEFVDDNGNDLTGFAYDAEGPESRTNITLLKVFSLNSKTISSSLSWTHVGDDFTTTELYDYSQLHNYSTLDFTSSLQISDSQTLTLVGKNITDELYGYAQFGDPVLASIQTTYYAPGEEWKLTYQQSF